MPIYEYRCASCGAEMEKLQKISDPPLVECPECGKETLVKLVSASSFRLKGSGWYETDFKTGKKKNGAGDADSTAPESAKDSVSDDKSSTGNAGIKESGKDSASASKDSKTESKAETKKDGAKESATGSSKETQPASDSAGAGNVGKPNKPTTK